MEVQTGTYVAPFVGWTSARPGTVVPSARWKGPGRRRCLLERRVPRRLEVQGVDEHQPGRRVDAAPGQDLGDPVMRLLRGPVVHQAAGRLRGAEVHGPHPGAVLLGQHGQERALPVDRRVSEQLVGR